MKPITSEDKIVYAELGEEPVKSLLYKNVLMFLDQFEGISADIRTHLPTIKKMEVGSDYVIVCVTAIAWGLSYMTAYMYITVCVEICVSV